MPLATYRDTSLQKNSIDVLTNGSAVLKIAEPLDVAEAETDAPAPEKNDVATHSRRRTLACWRYLPMSHLSGDMVKHIKLRTIMIKFMPILWTQRELRRLLEECGGPVLRVRVSFGRSTSTVERTLVRLLNKEKGPKLFQHMLYLKENDLMPVMWVEFATVEASMKAQAALATAAIWASMTNGQMAFNLEKADAHSDTIKKAMYNNFSDPNSSRVLFRPRSFKSFIVIDDWTAIDARLRFSPERTTNASFPNGSREGKVIPFTVEQPCLFGYAYELGGELCEAPATDTLLDSLLSAPDTMLTRHELLNNKNVPEKIAALRSTPVDRRLTEIMKADLARVESPHTVTATVRMKSTQTSPATAAVPMKAATQIEMTVPTAPIPFTAARTIHLTGLPAALTQEALQLLLAHSGGELVRIRISMVDALPKAESVVLSCPSCRHRDDVATANNYKYKSEKEEEDEDKDVPAYTGKCVQSFIEFTSVPEAQRAVQDLDGVQVTVQACPRGEKGTAHPVRFGLRCTLVADCIEDSIPTDAVTQQMSRCDGSTDAFAPLTTLRPCLFACVYRNGDDFKPVPRSDTLFDYMQYCTSLETEKKALPQTLLTSSVAVQVAVPPVACAGLEAEVVSPNWFPRSASEKVKEEPWARMTEEGVDVGALPDKVTEGTQALRLPSSTSSLCEPLKLADLGTLSDQSTQGKKEMVENVPEVREATITSVDTRAPRLGLDPILHKEQGTVTRDESLEQNLAREDKECYKNLNRETAVQRHAQTNEILQRTVCIYGLPLSTTQKYVSSMLLKYGATFLRVRVVPLASVQTEYSSMEHAPVADSEPEALVFVEFAVVEGAFETLRQLHGLRLCITVVSKDAAPCTLQKQKSNSSLLEKWVCLSCTYASEIIPDVTLTDAIIEYKMGTQMTELSKMKKVWRMRCRRPCLFGSYNLIDGTYVPVGEYETLAYYFMLPPGYFAPAPLIPSSVAATGDRLPIAPLPYSLSFLSRVPVDVVNSKCIPTSTEFSEENQGLTMSHPQGADERAAVASQWKSEPSGHTSATFAAASQAPSENGKAFGLMGRTEQPLSLHIKQQLASSDSDGDTGGDELELHSAASVIAYVQCTLLGYRGVPNKSGTAAAVSVFQDLHALSLAYANTDSSNSSSSSEAPEAVHGRVTRVLEFLLQRVLRERRHQALTGGPAQCAPANGGTIAAASLPVPKQYTQLYVFVTAMLFLLALWGRNLQGSMRPLQLLLEAVEALPVGRLRVPKKLSSAYGTEWRFQNYVTQMLVCVGLALEGVEPVVARRAYELASARARDVLGLRSAALEEALQCKEVVGIRLEYSSLSHFVEQTQMNKDITTVPSFVFSQMTWQREQSLKMGAGSFFKNLPPGSFCHLRSI